MVRRAACQLPVQRAPGGAARGHAALGLARHVQRHQPSPAAPQAVHWGESVFTHFIYTDLISFEIPTWLASLKNKKVCLVQELSHGVSK